MAVRSDVVLVAAATMALVVASCTLNQQGTGELAAGTGGTSDASVGGSAGTSELGGAGGSSAGGSGVGGSTGGAAGLGGSGTGGTTIDAGTGGTSTGGSSTGGSSTGGSEAGVNDAGPETNCLNGLDDDGDGLVDCADPDCQALYQCVASPPVGWEGTYRVRELAWSDPAPPIEPCPDGSTATRYYVEASGPIVCACGCDALTGASCNPPPIGCSESDNCSDPLLDWTNTLANGSCQKPNIGNSGNLSCKLLGSPTVASDGACSPTVTKSSVAPFASFLDVCGTPNGPAGCFPGYACTAKSGGAYTGLPCVRAADNQTCPSGWGARHFAYGSYTDTRDCTACACTPQPSCSGGGYTFYDKNGCNASDNDIKIADANCHDVSNNLDANRWSIRLTSSANASGQCAGSGGLSTGSLDTSAPVTFCCQQ